MSQSVCQKILERAKSGDAAARNQLLEVCRQRLRKLSDVIFDARLSPVWDPSDAVQESLLDVCRDFSAFEGKREEQLYAWLQRILENNLADRRKYEGRLKRRCSPNAFSRRDHLRDEPVVSGDSSVSQRLIRREQVEQVWDTLDELPQHQAMVVRMKYLEGCSLEEIAENIGRTRPAVAGLLIRAMRQLRRQAPIRTES